MGLGFSGAIERRLEPGSSCRIEDVERTVWIHPQTVSVASDNDEWETGGGLPPERQRAAIPCGAEAAAGVRTPLSAR